MSPTVFVIDDDAAVRDSLARLLEAHRLPVRTYDSAEGFLAALHPTAAGCLVLDVRLPRMSGPELQATLAARGIRLPIIFLTGQGDIPTSVRTLQAGALDFLEKPVAGELLLERVRGALRLEVKQRRERAQTTRARARYAQLTPREREVMGLLVAGQSSKEIARRLGISHRTVEIHRGRVMHKMHAANLIELAAAAQASDGSTDLSTTATRLARNSGIAAPHARPGNPPGEEGPEG
jgi:FixJ family two-component response regulator